MFNLLLNINIDMHMFIICPLANYNYFLKSNEQIICTHKVRLPNYKIFKSSTSKPHKKQK